jgi:hypothetical protein
MPKAKKNRRPIHRTPWFLGDSEQIVEGVPSTHGVTVDDRSIRQA